MAQPSQRATELPKGLYHRGEVIWGRYKDPSGKWRDRSLGLPVGREREASKLLAEIKRQVATGKETGLDPTQGVPSFAAFFAWWIDKRKARGKKSWRDDEGRIRNHALDLLGEMPLDEITPLVLEQVFERMKARDKAPKTIWNVYAALRAMFREAVTKGFLASSPCMLSNEELGPMVDKDPEWRATALFERAEVGSLMFDERIPPDRRMFYAVTYFAGRRLGETSGVRVRQVDLEAEPLGSLLFARSYANGRTKTNEVVRMPIHPVLGDMLRGWLTTGFRELMGRDPPLCQDSCSDSLAAKSACHSNPWGHRSRST